MNVDGSAMRTIWLSKDGQSVEIIDQRALPHRLVTETLSTVEDATVAIREMWVRGAPLIGATAAYGLALAMNRDPSDESLTSATDMLMGARPTAVNLRWALEDVGSRLEACDVSDRASVAYQRAAEICDEDVEINASIGSLIHSSTLKLHTSSSFALKNTSSAIGGKKIVFLSS